MIDRNFQMMSTGLGAQTLGTVAAIPSRLAQASSHEFPIQICMTGPTSARPRAGDPDMPCPNGLIQGGVHYLDTTLGYIVISDGSGNWRNPLTGAVA
jgi:hypothetical protein